MITDKRKLKLFEKNLGLFSVASAICSYGDVIDFVDGSKQGIILVDTCGHNEDYGRKMAAFLRQEIANGWGVTGNSQEELLILGKKLEAMKGPERDPVHTKWYDAVPAEYLQFNGENVSLSIRGGLGHTLILRNDSLEEILVKGGTIDNEYITEHGPVYNTILQKDELIFLQSDGLIGNIAESLNYKLNEHEVKSLLIETLEKQREQTTKVIRDALVSRFDRYFLPQDPGYDDVTFAVVKRAQ